jgi:thiol-disulfide isomerase/thioredoxin
MPIFYFFLRHPEKRASRQAYLGSIFPILKRNLGRSVDLPREMHYTQRAFWLAIISFLRMQHGFRIARPATRLCGMTRDLYNKIYKKLLPFICFTLFFNPCYATENSTLLTYWRSDCPPCRAELGTIVKLAENHSDLQIHLIVLKVPFDKPAIPKIPTNMHIMHADRIPASYNNAQSILPFSVFLHKDGGLCETHTGMLGSDMAEKWIKQC